MTIGDDALPPHAIPAGLTFWWGLGDTFHLQGRASYAVHPAAPPFHLFAGSIELIYLIDLLRVVPTLGAGVDVVYATYSGRGAIVPAAHIVAGLDYLLDRRWSVGVDVRPYLLPFRLRSVGGAIVHLSVSLRITVVFDA